MAQPKPLPPLEELRSAFAYCPETGALTWRETRPNQVRARSPAGCPNEEGYIKVKLGQRSLKAHRICYALHHGTDPGEALVDHINRNRLDNRICNLRLVDAKGNRANSAGLPPPPPPKRPVQVIYPDGQSQLFTSRAAAAAALGCSPRAIYRYARGLRQHPAGLTVAYA